MPFRTVIVSPNNNKTTDDFIDVLAHEGMHTVVGPMWGRFHDQLQDQARDIVRQYWADPSGSNTSCGSNHYGAYPTGNPLDQIPAGAGAGKRF